MFLVTRITSQWQRLWNMHTMTIVFLFWPRLIMIWRMLKNIRITLRHIRSILISQQGLCADLIRRVNGVHRLTRDHLIIETMIIAKVQHGSGHGLFRMMWMD